MRNCNYGAVVGAFLTGALIGGAVALLLAPRSGAETRGMIRDYIDEEVDAVKGKAAARDHVEEEIDRYKRRARRAAGKAVEKAAERLEDEIETVKKRATRRTTRKA